MMPHNMMMVDKKSSAGGNGPAGKPCNCRKSRCLKLYCECFSNYRYCGPHCACVGCNNSEQFNERRF